MTTMAMMTMAAEKLRWWNLDASRRGQRTCKTDRDEVAKVHRLWLLPKFPFAIRDVATIGDHPLPSIRQSLMATTLGSQHGDENPNKHGRNITLNAIIRRY
jgi:hypothetical protein